MVLDDDKACLSANRSTAERLSRIASAADSDLPTASYTPLASMSSTPGIAEMACEDSRTPNSWCVSSYQRRRMYSSPSWPSDAARTSAAPLLR
eukprot:7216240-Alexandrium_andersonii.AAC.1